ncbi:MAG: hypothetical protein CL878_15280 [Dehalococcoidia bacterium]|nr:hypothetical protein [Dehalococcoidia bacterium]
MSADDRQRATDQRHLRAWSGARRRRSRQHAGSSNGHPVASDAAEEWESQERWLVPEAAVDTVGDPIPSRPPRSTRRRRRTEWWLLLPLTLALFVIFQVALAQRSSQDTGASLEASLGPGQPTAIPTVPPLPTPSISYSANRLARVAGGSLGAAPIGVIPGAPALDAQAAILVDIGTRDVLYAKNHHTARAMASTIKIVTAIVALEHAPLNTIIEVGSEAAGMEPNRMGLQVGERLTLEELLYGLMLDSGNDAAEAIARGVFGDRARFIRLMNDLASELGLQNTHFVNPSGLDDVAQYASAYDLAVLATYALQNPIFREVVGTRRKVITASSEPGREHGWFGPTNLNRLLGTYAGAFGVKPGWTGDAGYTLVAGAERGGRSLLAVVLGSRGHFTDAGRLLDYGFVTPAG